MVEHRAETINRQRCAPGHGPQIVLEDESVTMRHRYPVLLVGAARDEFFDAGHCFRRVAVTKLNVSPIKTEKEFEQSERHSAAAFARQPDAGRRAVPHE